MLLVRLALAAAAGLALVACAGSSGTAVAGPPADAGHGSVEEVIAVLERQGVPCRGSKPSALPAGTEQAVTCSLEPDGDQVLLVHFFDVAGSKAFEKVSRDADEHGVYADTWAAVTETERAAEVIADAVVNRGSSVGGT